MKKIRAFLKSHKLILLIVLAFLVLVTDGFLAYKFFVKPKTTVSTALPVTSPSPTPTVSPSATVTPTPETTATPERVEEEPTAEPAAEEPAATPEPSPPAVVNDSGITIRGDQNCQDQTTTALNTLKAAAAQYATATQYIGIIECVAAGSGIYVQEEPPRYLAGDATRNAGSVWYASTIAHDSCHSREYHEGRIHYGREAEAECLGVQKSALESMGAPQRTIDYVQNIINSEYWEIPSSERWW